MTPKLTEEQRRALDAQQGDPVLVEDDRTHRVYFIYTEDLHQRAKRALQEQEDLASIQRGIEQMETGLGRSLNEADASMREKLGFSKRP
jgi:hypothetical protein